MEKLLFICVLISFLTTLFIMPKWIKRAKNAGLAGKDMHKNNDEKVAEAGGIGVILGFLLGVLIYIAIKTFYFQDSNNLVEIFALLCTILLISFVGMIDDILGWKIGLGKRTRILFVLFASIPLMVINAGYPEISLPFFGVINFGIFYALIIIPLGMIGASTTFNFLAGYNGLEASQGILILSALAIVSEITGSSWLSLIALCMVASLIAFWIYNKYPSKVFPGDVLTYSVGGMIAIMAILGNYEMFAVFIFIPYIIEVGLKLRGKLEKESFGKPDKDGSIKNQYDKVYGLEHLAIKILEKIKSSKKAYEWEVVLLINLFQLLIIILGFFIFII
ncbi:MAG: glycosyltransferase 4 family protein [Candidatus Pacearchaeota archaeon]|jgi:UDP-N-acetylglucosamine--dolichyl-phosphate N-acetylglucosaminephosphotransferase